MLFCHKITHLTCMYVAYVSKQSFAIISAIINYLLHTANNSFPITWQ